MFGTKVLEVILLTSEVMVVVAMEAKILVEVPPITRVPVLPRL